MAIPSPVAENARVSQTNGKNGVVNPQPQGYVKTRR